MGKRVAGGYEGELDVVAFHPKTKHLIHIEPSMDTNNWQKCEDRYSKKFAAGRKFIPALFDGLDLPEEIEQIALFVYASDANHKTVGGGQVMIVNELLCEIIEELKSKSIKASMIPEHLTILRSLQFVAHYKRDMIKALS